MFLPFAELIFVVGLVEGVGHKSVFIAGIVANVGDGLVNVGCA